MHYRRLNWVRLNHSRTTWKLENRDLKVERADKVTPPPRNVAQPQQHRLHSLTLNIRREQLIRVCTIYFRIHEYGESSCISSWWARRGGRLRGPEERWGALMNGLEGGGLRRRMRSTHSHSHSVSWCVVVVREWASESIPESQVHRARMWIIYSEWLALWLIIRRLEGESRGRMLFVIFSRVTPPLRLFRFAPHACWFAFSLGTKVMSPGCFCR